MSRKLSDEQVKAIHKDNRLWQTIANEYEVHLHTIKQIKLGKTHRHLNLGPTPSARQRQFYRQLPKLNQTVNYRPELPYDSTHNRLWRKQQRDRGLPDTPPQR